MTSSLPFNPQATYYDRKDHATPTTNQFDRCGNTAIQQRLGLYTDTTAGNVNGMFGSTAVTIASLSQLNNEFTFTYKILNTTNYMVYMITELLNYLHF